VQIYNNLLILKTRVTEEPFIHIIASGDVFTKSVYHKKIWDILFKLLDEKIINILGGKTLSVNKFAKEKGLCKKNFWKKLSLVVGYKYL